MELMSTPTLNAIQTNLDPALAKTSPATHPTWTFPCSKGGPYRIFLASTPALRDRAKALVNNVYQKRGYTINNDELSHFNDHKTPRPDFTLLAENTHGEAAGSVSLNLDSPTGLPSDEIFGEEVAALRKQGQRMAEVTGFAISDEHTRSKALLVHLLDFIFILARRECPNGTVVIEVNPRHENYYQKLMKFEKAGPVRSCHRVQGAPARLLRLDLAQQREAIRLEAGPANAMRAGKSRSLYKHFHPLEEEANILFFLEQSGSVTPMSKPATMIANQHTPMPRGQTLFQASDPRANETQVERRFTRQPGAFE